MAHACALQYRVRNSALSTPFMATIVLTSILSSASAASLPSGQSITSAFSQRAEQCYSARGHGLERTNCGEEFTLGAANAIRLLSDPPTKAGASVMAHSMSPSATSHRKKTSQLRSCRPLRTPSRKHVMLGVCMPSYPRSVPLSETIQFVPSPNMGNSHLMS
jgi:hypothetical protein